MTTSFFLTKWLYLAMSWVYDSMCNLFATSSGGWVVVLTILIFTIGIKGITLFTDISSRKSSIKMQAIQPDLDKLKKKYGDDPQRLNVEQRKLMKERGVSSFGGCLPMLFMFPLLIMFWNAFRAWSNAQTLDLLIQIYNGNGLATFEGYKFLWITNIWQPDNLAAGGTLMNASTFWSTFTSTYPLHNSIFYEKNADILNEILYKLHFLTRSAEGELIFAKDGGAAFQTAYASYVSVITNSIKGGYENMSNGIAILPLLAGASSFLSAFISQKNNPQAQAKDKDGEKPQGAGMTKAMMYVMPLISVFFCYQYNATFAFYWTFSNLVSLGVTVVLNHTMFKKKPDNGEVMKKL